MENKSETRLVGMLGFAMRAGKIVIGTDLVCRSLAKRGRVLLVLVSQSASLGTKNKIFKKCKFHNVDCSEIPIEQAELGRLLGKAYAPSVVAICDTGFAFEISKALSDIKNAASDDI